MDRATCLRFNVPYCDLPINVRLSGEYRVEAYTEGLQVTMVIIYQDDRVGLSPITYAEDVCSHIRLILEQRHLDCNKVRWVVRFGDGSKADDWWDIAFGSYQPRKRWYGTPSFNLVFPPDLYRGASS